MLGCFNANALFMFQNYFRDGWNIFDFVIVLITFSGVVLNFARVRNHLGNKKITNWLPAVQFGNTMDTIDLSVLV